MWTQSQILDLLSTKKAAIAVASVTAFASGAAGGYFFASKKLQKHYRLVADEEILAAKLFYARRNKTEEFSDPTELAEKYEREESDEEDDEPVNLNMKPQSDMLREAVDILEKQKYTSYNQPEQTQEEVEEATVSIKKNVFDDQPTDNSPYDVSVELEKKENGKPYIIPVAEYMNNENRYAQICVTYYEEDDTVANEIDIPMEPYETTLGDDNLHFGRGSGDPNVVYIQNDDLEEVFEVVRSRGSFEMEAAPLKHSDSSRRFREGDGY